MCALSLSLSLYIYIYSCMCVSMYIFGPWRPGAMENKSLNIFNSRLVLATPQIATDANYEAIEAVVAHEYFHNWTGLVLVLDFHSSGAKLPGEQGQWSGAFFF